MPKSKECEEIGEAVGDNVGNGDETDAAATDPQQSGVKSPPASHSPVVVKPSLDTSVINAASASRRPPPLPLPSPVVAPSPPRLASPRGGRDGEESGDAAPGAAAGNAETGAAKDAADESPDGGGDPGACSCRAAQRVKELEAQVAALELQRRRDAAKLLELANALRQEREKHDTLRAAVRGAEQYRSNQHRGRWKGVSFPASRRTLKLIAAHASMVAVTPCPGYGPWGKWTCCGQDDRTAPGCVVQGA